MRDPGNRQARKVLRGSAQPRSPAAARHRRLVDRIAKLTGAGRVLLLLDGADGLALAAARLPAGEDAGKLHAAIAPWIDDARRSRRARLRVGPGGAPRVAQRSCIVAPLLDGRALVGILYVDIDGTAGRLASADRELVAALAEQAASEHAARLAAARLAGENERRNAELAVIASIQQGIAGSLSFNAIVEQVGDKLRELLHLESIGIRWYDHDTRTVHFLYEIEHGKRVTMASVRPSQARWGEVTSDRGVIVRNTAAEVAAAGVAPGTECSLSTLTVKIVAQDRVVGVVLVESFEREYAFGESDIRLLQTIVASMGAALENARLFNEAQEALQQQKASAEVLAVISSSVADTQPVFDKILDSCKHLFGGDELDVLLVDDQGQLQVAAYVGKARDAVMATFPAPVAGSAPGRAISERRVAHYADVLNDPDTPPVLRRVAKLAGYHSVAFAPMLWEERGIGVVGVARSRGPFSDKELALLQTFADQAVIAIQNSRLFKETKEALEQQTATAGILKVIAGSPSNVQPVFDAIVRNAVTICDALFANVFRFDGEMLHWGASHNLAPESVEMLRGSYPMRPTAMQISGRVITSRAIAGSADVLSDPDYDQRFAIAGGWRRILGAPMLRDGEPVGVIVVGWREAGPIPPRYEEILSTFADQAVIAIENVRLFNETKEALEQQTATAEILRVISGSVTDTQPVFDAIVQSCRRLFSGKAVALAMPRGDMLGLVAFARDRGIGSLEPWPLDRGSGAGACIIDSRLIVVPDTAEAAREFVRMPQLATALGYRSCLFVPLLREGKAIGCLAILRASAGKF
ncbi:MAG: GAF domain-containing protein, partial [Caldimonas sp.]